MIDQRLKIPYTKLKFHIVFPEGGLLPSNKVSALRGGMGEMLLRQNCIKDRVCLNCQFRETCLIHFIFYTKMEQKPPFMQGEDSIGYLLECDNYHTNFQAGNEMDFYLVLFGRNIAYFWHYFQAFHWLGSCGIGKAQVKFIVQDVENEWGQKIISGNTVNMKYYQIRTVEDYVKQRLNYMKRKGLKNTFCFHTPLALKYQGEFIRDFQAEPIFQAALRRVMMYDYFVGQYLESPKLLEYPKISFQCVRLCDVKRYSNTKNQKMILRGITGKVVYDKLPEEVLPYLLAGELLHIGKNSSFGFGKYEIQ